jgi:hypothetical protein
MLRRLLVVLLFLLVVYASWRGRPSATEQVLELRVDPEVSSDFSQSSQASLSSNASRTKSSRMPSSLGEETRKLQVFDGDARPLSAQEKARRVASKREWLARLRALATGPVLKVSDRRVYREVPGLRAYPESLSDQVSNENIVERRPGIIFAKQEARDREAGWPVVWNEKSGRLGALSGQFKVKLRNARDAQSIARDMGLGLVKYFDPIQMAILSSSEGQDPARLLESLRHDSRVLRADLEILEGSPKAQ